MVVVDTHILHFYTVLVEPPQELMKETSLVRRQIPMLQVNVGSCRYSHLAFLYGPSRTTTRTYEENFIGSATDTNVTGECALGSYMWTDEHPDVRSPFAVYSVSRI